MTKQKNCCTNKDCRWNNSKVKNYCQSCIDWVKENYPLTTRDKIYSPRFKNILGNEDNVTTPDKLIKNMNKYFYYERLQDEFIPGSEIIHISGYRELYAKCLNYLSDVAQLDVLHKQKIQLENDKKSKIDKKKREELKEKELVKSIIKKNPKLLTELGLQFKDTRESLDG